RVLFRSLPPPPTPLTGRGGRQHKGFSRLSPSSPGEGGWEGAGEEGRGDEGLGRGDLEASEVGAYADSHHSPVASGRISGKRITSRIDCRSAISIVSRSMPMPIPAAGGMACSRART